MRMSKQETKVEKEKFNLDEVFSLWKKQSKDGKDYLTGTTKDGARIIGFINDKKDNTPKVRIYSTKEDGSREEEIIALWESISKQDNLYLSGLTNENEKIIAFYSNNKENNRPYIKGYYKKD